MKRIEALVSLSSVVSAKGGRRKNHAHNQYMQISRIYNMYYTERENVRQRGSGAESQARALRADQGLYTQN